MSDAPALPAKVLIVDDHQMFIDGLKLVLRKAENIKVVAHALSGKQALEILKQQGIDMVIADIHMPEMSGTELTKIIKRDYPNVKILIVTSFSDYEIVKEIFNSEAEGYILKNAGKHELLLAIEKIISGSIYYCNEVNAIMIKNLQIKKEQNEYVKSLTARELEIVKLICQEFSNNEIAAQLFISPLTVETHRKNILHKTHCKSVVGLIKLAIDNGLI